MSNGTVELSLIEQILEFETALVAESTGAMGCAQPEKNYMGRDIRLVTQKPSRIAGIALTLTCDTSTPDKTPDASGLWEGLQKITDLDVPVVVVMKVNGSRLQHECVLGDGMAKLFANAGSCGLITDGGVRDLAVIDLLNFPVYAAGTLSNHAQIVYRLSEEPVSIGGITVSNGDLLHADNDGIVKVPQEYHRGIVEACILSREFETRVHIFWRRSDKSLKEKMELAAKLNNERTEKCKKLMNLL